MGNSTSHYERHEDDEQQQRTVISRDFRLVLGQLELSSDPTKKKRTILLSNQKPRHRKVSSSSSSNTTIASSSSSSSSSDQRYSSVALIHLDIPTSPFDSNELNTHAFLQYLLDQDSYGKELTHIFRAPPSTGTQTKSRLKSLPTVSIAAVYYDQPASSNEVTIETISLLDEKDLDNQFAAFNNRTILSIYASNTKVYVVSTKALSRNTKYTLVRSTTMSKTVLENFEWLHPFVQYSNLGYRLCGLIRWQESLSDASLTVYWLFERSETTETKVYDHCIVEYQLKASSLNGWTPLLNLMAKEEWKLAATFEYNQKRKTGEQIYYLLFFQKFKN